jgi:hypothetical protein
LADFDMQLQRGLGGGEGSLGLVEVFGVGCGGGGALFNFVELGEGLFEADAPAVEGRRACGVAMQRAAATSPR